MSEGEVSGEPESYFKKLKEWIDSGRFGFNKDGRLVLGVPVVIIPRADLAEIQKTAEEVLGESGAAVVMYRAGFKHGYRHAEIYAKEFGLEGFDIINKHLSVVSMTGWWGRFEIVETSENPLRVVVRFYNTIAEEWKDAGRSVCHLWRGALAGMLAFIAESMGKKVKVRGHETKCIAKGDPYCEIVAEETPA